MAVPLRIALFAALATSLGAQAQTGAKTPSGQSYLVTGKGPVVGPKGAEKALGLSYELERSAAPEQLDAEASDLMSALLPEAELGHFQGVLITATTKPGGGFVSAGKSYHRTFLRGPAGEWAAARGKAEPALGKRLGELYVAADLAFKALDEKAIRAFCTGDFLHGLVGGTVRTLEQDLAAARGAIKSVSAWKTVIDGYYRHKEHVFVMTTQTWTGEVRGEKGAAVRVTSTSKGVDTWVAGPGGGLKLERSLDLEEKNAPAP